MAVCGVLLRLPASRGEALALVAGQVLILVKVEHLTAWVEGLVQLLLVHLLLLHLRGLSLRIFLLSASRICFVESRRALVVLRGGWELTASVGALV